MRLWKVESTVLNRPNLMARGPCVIGDIDWEWRDAKQ